MRLILVLFSVFLLSSCAKPILKAPITQSDNFKNQSLAKEVRLQLKSITAQDLQENVTLRDELLMQIAIVRIKGDTVFTIGSKWIYIGSIAQGQRIDLDSVQLKSATILPGERVGVQVSLWELDDYSKDQAFIHKLNQVSGLVQIPMTLMEWSSFSNPVSWFIWGARLGSVGLDWWAKRDAKDLLGVSEVQWDYSDMPKGKMVRFKRGTWKGGNRGLGAYQYGFAYEIRVNDSSR
jgi:hypothetical protein